MRRRKNNLLILVVALGRLPAPASRRDGDAENPAGHPCYPWKHLFMMITMLQKLCFYTCFAAVVLASCAAKPLVNNEAAERNAGVNNRASEEKLHYLDLNNPSIVQPINSKDNAAGSSFVQVEVTEVVNQKKHPVAFEVYYRAKTSEKVYLGSFGLFPSDNPGKFIVATQGKLKNEGAIVLTLVKPDKVDAGDVLKVAVRKISFVNN
ncbi:MAG TPA: hypothetical protein VGO68_15440 [Pyrinomonadaceae bacterium]|jgi:hypothetical protein|nr:hypothetical protein [Pyrinomonadaceae bacterium]